MTPPMGRDCDSFVRVIHICPKQFASEESKENRKVPDRKMEGLIFLSDSFLFASRVVGLRRLERLLRSDKAPPEKRRRGEIEL